MAAVQSLEKLIVNEATTWNTLRNRRQGGFIREFA